MTKLLYLSCEWSEIIVFEKDWKDLLSEILRFFDNKSFSALSPVY